MDDCDDEDVPSGEPVGEGVREEVEQLPDGRAVRFFSWVGDPG